MGTLNEKDRGEWRLFAPNTLKSAHQLLTELKTLHQSHPENPCTCVNYLLGFWPSISPEIALGLLDGTVLYENEGGDVLFTY